MMKIIVKLINDEYYMIYKKFDGDYEAPVTLKKFDALEDCLDVAKEFAEVQLLPLEVPE